MFRNGASLIVCDPGFSICPQSFYSREKGQGTKQWADVTCKNCLPWKGKEERESDAPR